jgi:hypothetical protein
MRFATIFLVGVLGVSASMLVACKKPKEGDPCTAGAVCADPQTGLFCNAGKWKSMGCRGPGGCKVQSGNVNCDDTLANLKDGCDEENEVACQTDKKAALECHSGNFVVGETCKGPKGCVVDGEKIQCDNDVADDGDPCHFEGDYACASDKTMAFKCISKKMVSINSCRGPKGCRVQELPGNKLEFDCDDSIAKEGDPCDEENELACTMDKTSLMTCKSGKFAVHKPCPGAKGCSFDDKGEKFECDSTGTAGKTATEMGSASPGQPHKPPPKKK